MTAYASVAARASRYRAAVCSRCGEGYAGAPVGASTVDALASGLAALLASACPGDALAAPAHSASAARHVRARVIGGRPLPHALSAAFHRSQRSLQRALALGAAQYRTDALVGVDHERGW